MEERLQKYLANNGIAARRKCEEFILDGRVKVNGKVVTELGTKINPEKDIIEFDGKKVEKVEKHVYILLNKPIGYVTTVKDQFDRPTVLDLVKIKEKLSHIEQDDEKRLSQLRLNSDAITSELEDKVNELTEQLESVQTDDVLKQKLEYWKDKAKTEAARIEHLEKQLIAYADGNTLNKIFG